MGDWQSKWNERYAKSERPYGSEPNQFLRESVGLIIGKNVLCVADGDGRNGLWLAQQGFNVTSLDYSDVAINNVQNLASRNGVTIKTECVDLLKADWPKDAFDAVVIVYSHFSEQDSVQLFQKYIGALKDKGLIIFECFSKSQIENSSGGPKDTDLLYSQEFIQSAFQSLETIMCKEMVTTLAEGELHKGVAHVVRCLARKIK